MTGLASNKFSQFKDDAGIPVENGTIEVFENTTTTLTTIFTDQTGDTAQANPYTLDASGRTTGDVYWTGFRTVRLKDQFDAVIRTLDFVTTLEDASTFYAPSKNTAIIFNTVADMISGTLPDGSTTVLEIGQTASTKGYTTIGDGGDNTYDIGSGFGTADGGSIIDLNVLQAQGIFPGAIYHVNQWGASNTATAVQNNLSFQNAVTFVTAQDGKLHITRGPYDLSEASDLTGPINIEGNGASEIHWFNTTPRITTNAFVAESLFRYIDQDYPNGGIENVTISGLVVRGMTAESIEHYVFCSLAFNNGELINGQMCARVDRFNFFNNNMYDIEGHITYGKEFISRDNVAYNTLTTTLQLDRNFAFNFNHAINQNDDTFDDLVRSDCEIYSNKAFGFGGGVVAQSWFNLTDESRFAVEHVSVHDNWCIGGDLNAPIIGRLGVFVASVKKANVYGNWCVYASDVGIDLEHVIDCDVHHNSLENCAMAQFWECNENKFNNNTVILTDDAWFDAGGSGAGQFFRKTGGATVGTIVVENNTCQAQLSGTRVGNMVGLVGIGQLHISNNKLLNGVLNFNSDVDKVLVNIENNQFYFDKVIGDVSPIDATLTGDASIINNRFYSQTVTAGVIARLPQTTLFPAINLIANRALSGEDMRKCYIKENVVYEWITSIHMGEVGTANQRWTVVLTDNEYDGAFTNAVTDPTDNRFFIKNNFYLVDVDGGTAGIFPADPVNPTAAAALLIEYRGGSEIPVLGTALSNTPGTTSRYVLSNEPSQIWTSVADW